jgi:hypothetical protein
MGKKIPQNSLVVSVSQLLVHFLAYLLTEYLTDIYKTVI